LVEQLSGQQESISGVNLDEEMSNLIRYQQTFQASARFMSTIGSMLDVLMNI
jgi:flagellar hook-associated protein 1 FlgK